MQMIFKYRVKESCRDYCLGPTLGLTLRWLFGHYCAIQAKCLRAYHSASQHRRITALPYPSPRGEGVRAAIRP